MDIVAAFACSHAGFLVSHYDKASPEQRDAVYQGFSRVRGTLAESRADALLILATDHGRVYPATHQPQYVIGVSASAHGIGDALLPECEVPIHQRFAQAVLEGCLVGGMDLAYSEAMRIDHSFVTPLLLSTPDFDLPIVPLVQNTRLPPMPTLRRSYEVGRIIGQALRQGPAGRVAVMGTGGLSHWVGDERRQAFLRQPAGMRYAVEQDYPLVLPERGRINAEFDQRFMASLAEGGAAAWIADWPEERIYAEAGNGGQEVRNWLTIAGMVDDRPLEVLGYAPVAEWLTGSAVARFRL
jgi:2,3-dihydroxyphenylpropionate 1,2-dioxygenase